MGDTKCPVCQWEINEEEGKSVEVGSRVILVCCDDCAAKVKAEPDKYAIVGS